MTFQRRYGAFALAAAAATLSACASGPMAADKARREAAPPERTSDKGDRLLVPTPVGGLAPEVPPSVGPGTR